MTATPRVGRLSAHPPPRAQTFSFLLIDTFVGAGIVVGGRMWEGVRGASANLGSMLVSDRRGQARFVHELASLFALRRRLEVTGLSAEEALAAPPGSEGARQVEDWIADASYALAQAILNTATVIDHEVAILDADLPRPVLERLVKATAEQVDGLPSLGDDEARLSSPVTWAGPVRLSGHEILAVPAVLRPGSQAHGVLAGEGGCIGPPSEPLALPCLVRASTSCGSDTKIREQGRHGMAGEGNYEIIDKRFAALVSGVARLDKLYEGCKWAETAWFGGGRYVVWSDIPNNRMLRYDETDGSVSVFRSPSDNSNGNTVDRQGRLVTCEHGGRRVSRTEHDGKVITLADRYEGKRLNSPNDAVVKSDGSIWFTDPSYGIDSDYEGNRAESEIGRCNVYRIDGQSGAVTAVITDMVRPNGIAFSLDESQLYVADTGRTHVENGPAHIRVFDVGGEKVTGGGRIRRAWPGCSTVSGSTRRDGFGPARRTASAATSGTGRWVRIPGARSGGERGVRRHQAQRALHLRHDLALCDASDGERRGDILTTGGVAHPHPLPPRKGEGADAGIREVQRAVQPPSTKRVWPVIIEAASEARKTTASATSRGWPMRWSAAMRSITSALKAGRASISAVPSVSMKVGATQLTRTLFLPHSTAKHSSCARPPPCRGNRPLRRAGRQRRPASPC